MEQECRDHWYGPPWYSRRRYWTYTPNALARRARALGL